MPERKRRRQGGGRRRKVAAREQGSVSYRPYIERKIPYFEILDCLLYTSPSPRDPE